MAVREPTFRLATAGDPPRFPNTVATLRSAVRTYHDSGAATARARLRQGLSGPYWRAGIGAGKAAVARDLLNRYIAHADVDGRASFMFDLKSDVAVGSDVIAVNIDVSLLDTPSGYSGRIILWDTRPCNRQEALVLAAPCAAAIEQELGVGRSNGVAVWHMRSNATYDIPHGAAIRALTGAAAVVSRIQQ